MSTEGRTGKLKFAISVIALMIAAVTAFAQENQPWSQNSSPLPAPTGFVNDYAGVIDSSTKDRLEQKLKALKDGTNPSVEIAVAVVKTTGDRPIFDYSLAVARGWKIGSKADDNPSALLFIAIDDRKYFTHVSKDLEDELPDGVVGNLQRQYLVPEFKKQNYSKGIEDTINAYIATIENKGNVQATPTPTPRRTSAGSTATGMSTIACCFIIIVIVVIVIILISRSGRGGPTKRDRDRWGGGGFGSTGSNVASSALPWVIGSILSGSGGGSSGSSSSSDWGGSSGGGDFGGFGGGGDFGGGGSGGDW